MFQPERRDSGVPRPGKALEIPLQELDFSYSRSGGPGGQNVNKVSSKVTLKWDFWRSKALTIEQKGAIERDPILANRMTSDSVIVLHEQQTRSQDENRQLVIKKLHDLVANALAPKTERKETKVPYARKRARVEDKRKHSEKKGRRSQSFDRDRD